MTIRLPRNFFVNKVCDYRAYNYAYDEALKIGRLYEKRTHGVMLASRLWAHLRRSVAHVEGLTRTSNAVTRLSIAKFSDT